MSTNTRPDENVLGSGRLGSYGLGNADSEGMWGDLLLFHLQPRLKTD